MLILLEFPLVNSLSTTNKKKTISNPWKIRSISSHFFFVLSDTFHAHVQYIYIVYAKYQIASICTV